MGNHKIKKLLLEELKATGYCRSVWAGSCVLCSFEIKHRDLIVKPVGDVLPSRWYHARCLEKWLKAEGDRRAQAGRVAGGRRKSLANKGKK
jgi:hypothetical protein